MADDEDDAINFVLGNRPFATAVQQARGKHDGFYAVDKNELLRVAEIVRSYNKLMIAYNKLEDRYQRALTRYLRTSRALRKADAELARLRESMMDARAQEDEVTGS